MRRITVYSISVLLLVWGSLAMGETIYVDEDAAGANNGETWADAYNSLQDALVAAELADKPVEILVAQGTYKPAVPGGDRTATFQLINDVSLMGGYAGVGEADPDARDVELYETILSGDLNGDDIGFSNNGENSCHVVTGSGTDATAVLDGFTVSGGHANEWTSSDMDGGGMYNDVGSPTVNNCMFSGNTAHYGGGMYNTESSPTLTNCRFSGNDAMEYGGGMYNIASNPDVTNCTFSGNTGHYFSGGMHNWDSSPNVTNCTFSGNIVQGTGGGMSNEGGSATVTNCTFSGNTAFEIGGGMYNYLGNTDVTNCTFSGNTASFGGGMGNHMSTPTLTNCIVWANIATTDPQIRGEATVTYSDVQMPAGEVWPGTGNINADPLFVDAGDDNLRLLLFVSPCIDTGDNAGVPADSSDIDNDGDTIEQIPWDLDGNPRIDNDVVDMGAYESHASLTLEEAKDQVCGLLSLIKCKIGELDEDDIKSPNLIDNLLKKIDTVDRLIDEGAYEDARNKLTNDILKKMNGCANTGEPDNDDWILTCGAQETLYPLVEYVIALVPVAEISADDAGVLLEEAGGVVSGWTSLQVGTNIGDIEVHAVFEALYEGEEFEVDTSLNEVCLTITDFGSNEAYEDNGDGTVKIGEVVVWMETTGGSTIGNELTVDVICELPVPEE